MILEKGRGKSTCIYIRKVGSKTKKICSRVQGESVDAHSKKKLPYNTKLDPQTAKKKSRKLEYCNIVMWLHLNGKETCQLTCWDCTAILDLVSSSSRVDVDNRVDWKLGPGEDCSIVGFAWVEIFHFFFVFFIRWCK